MHVVGHLKGLSLLFFLGLPMVAGECLAISVIGNGIVFLSYCHTCGTVIDIHEDWDLQLRCDVQRPCNRNHGILLCLLLPAERGQLMPNPRRVVLGCPALLLSLQLHAGFMNTFGE